MNTGPWRRYALSRHVIMIVDRFYILFTALFYVFNVFYFYSVFYF